MKPGMEWAPVSAQRHFHSSKDPWISKNEPCPSCGFAGASLVYSEGGSFYELNEHHVFHQSGALLWLTPPLHGFLPGNLLHALGFWAQLRRKRIGCVLCVSDLCLHCQERPRSSLPFMCSKNWVCYCVCSLVLWNCYASDRHIV